MVADFPVHLDIESTNFCNLDCIMCPHRKMKRKQGRMKWEVFKRIIDQARDKTKTSYLHQIGEPLLTRKIVSMIDYTALAGIRTSISTNAMLLNSRWARRLCESRLDELTLALDGVTPETYNRYRVGGDFDTVLANILSFIATRKSLGRGPRVQLQMIHMEGNADEAKGLEEMFGRMLTKRDEILIKGFSSFAGFVPDFGGDTKPLRHRCGKTSTHMTIHWNGDVVICCRDFEGFTKVGNVMDASLSTIWHSPMYSAYRRQFQKQDFRGNKLCARC